MTKKKQKAQKISFRIITIALLAVSILCMIFRFDMVFTRVVQSIEDLIRSILYYFTEMGEPGRVHVTVNKIPGGMKTYLPVEWETFKAQVEAFKDLIFTEENLQLYFLVVGSYLSVGAEWILLLSIPVTVFILVLWLLYDTENNDYNKDTLPLRAYKWVESHVLSPVWRYVKGAAKHVRKSKAFLWLVLIWLYNLSAFTIAIEFVAFLFYFSISVDWNSIYTQFVKLGMDLTIPIGFLPWWVWAYIGWKLFSWIRRAVGMARLKHYEASNRAFLEVYLGALFVVGKQRAKKTTIITDMALTQEVIYRDDARELLATCDKQFPFFPWINVERFYRNAQARHVLPTLAHFRRFIGILRDFFETDYDPAIKKSMLRHLKKHYGYKHRDFIFGYDHLRYGTFYDNNLAGVNVFDAIENYVQLFYIYAAPTSLIFGNYSIRTDIKYDDKGNFPDIDADFFSSKATEIEKESQYCHIINFNSRRLGKVTDENDPGKDGVEFGVFNVMEFAKERGNQHTNAGMSVHDEECNVKNDGYELDVKMKGHDATIMYYTFKRDFYDDQRPDSLSAENKDLCDVIMIKGVSDEKIVLPCFSFARLFYGIATSIHDKIYYSLRYKRGDNTLLVYLIKRFYTPFHHYYDRLKNQFTVQTATLKIWDAMGDEVLNDKGKYYICHKKVYADRFATDGIKDFYHEKALRSKMGLNDYETFGDVHMTRAEMKKMHSRFYTQIDKIFRKEPVDTQAKKSTKKTR